LDAQSEEDLELHFGSIIAGDLPAALLLPKRHDERPIMAIVMIVIILTKFMGGSPLLEIGGDSV
jgi:hypothetical protein